MFRAMAIATLSLAFTNAAHAQFSNTPVTDTGFAWLLSGNLVRGEGAPPIEGGDEIGAFFGETLVGFVVITETQASNLEYSRLRIFGDNPTTNEIEGPTTNGIITLRYFDNSTNSTLTNVRALNNNGEAVNLAWQGGEVLNIVGLPLPPEVLTPSESIDIRIGAAGDDDTNGGNNGGGETPTGNPDVNGDGRITRADAAIVLRVVIGGGRNLDDATISRADVNGDGTVGTSDAIAVYKAM